MFFLVPSLFKREDIFLQHKLIYRSQTSKLNILGNINVQTKEKIYNIRERKIRYFSLNNFVNRLT